MNVTMKKKHFFQKIVTKFFRISARLKLNAVFKRSPIKLTLNPKALSSSKRAQTIP
jgi:hypothetical protein